MKRNEANYYGRPRSVAGDRSSSNTRNLTIPTNRTATRRVSMSSLNNYSTSPSSATATTMGRLSSSPITISSTHNNSSHKSISSSPNTSPIPHRRYSIRSGTSRPSSPAILSKSESNTTIHSATSRASKYSVRNKSISQESQQTKKWLN